MRSDRWSAQLRVAVVVTACMGAISSADAQTVPTTTISKERLLNPPRIWLTERFFLSGKDSSSSRVAALTVDTSGTVYILDSGTRNLTIVGKNGNSVRTVPVLTGPRKDFRSSAMAVARDTLLILGDAPCSDPCPPGVAGGASIPHVLVLDSKGESLGVIVPRDFLQQRPRLLFHSDLVRGTDHGWTIQVVSNPFMQSRPLPRALFADSLVIMQFDPIAYRASRLYASPGTLKYNTGFFIRQKFMAFYPTFGVASDGGIYANELGGYAINVRSSSGNALHRIIGEVDRIPVTDAEFRTYLNESLTRARKDRHEGADAAKELLDHGEWIGKEDFRSVLGQMFASRGGRVMARRLDLEHLAKDATQTIWDVISVSDGLLGRLNLPASERIAAFEWPYLYTRVTKPKGYAAVRYRMVIE